MFDRKLFGKNVKYYRTKKNLSAKDVCDLVNISPTYLYTIENGKNTPVVENIAKLAIALDVSYADLMNDSDDEKDISYILAKAARTEDSDIKFLVHVAKLLLEG